MKYASYEGKMYLDQKPETYEIIDISKEPAIYSLDFGGIAKIIIADFILKVKGDYSEPIHVPGKDKVLERYSYNCRVSLMKNLKTGRYEFASSSPGRVCSKCGNFNCHIDEYNFEENKARNGWRCLECDTVYTNFYEMDPKRISLNKDKNRNKLLVKALFLLQCLELEFDLDDFKDDTKHTHHIAQEERVKIIEELNNMLHQRIDPIKEPGIPIQYTTSEKTKSEVKDNNEVVDLDKNVINTVEV